MAIQDFTAGQILTAAQMDSLQANDYNWTVSTKTASYTLVAADKGTRVVMNSASATTITLNTSLFAAGDTLYLQNINTGVCTVTAGTATVTSAGSLAIPQWGSGTLYFTSASAAIYFPSAVTATPGALTYITGASFTTATSVSLPTDTFSATYRNYLVFFQITSSTADANITGRIRAAGSDKTGATYFQASVGLDSGGGTSNQTDSTTTSFTLGSVDDTFSSYALVMNFIAPKISEEAFQIVGTFGFVSSSLTQIGRNLYLRYGEVSPFTYDSFSWISSVASSISGAYRVYGYAES